MFAVGGHDHWSGHQPFDVAGWLGATDESSRSNRLHLSLRSGLGCTILGLKCEVPARWVQKSVDSQKDKMVSGSRLYCLSAKFSKVFSDV